MPAKTTIHCIFCQNVRARRTYLGLTQSQVAELLGISQPAYTAIETGKSCPSIEQADRVATILRTTAAELLTSQGIKGPLKKSMISVART